MISGYDYDYDYGKACPPSSYVMCHVGYHLFDVCVVTMTLLFVNPNSIRTICATIGNMYMSCIHPFPIVVLFASPSVLMLFHCAPCGVALPMFGFGCATNPCRDLFVRPCFVSPQTLKNSTILCTENPGPPQQPVCHAISRETCPLSAAASPCLGAGAPKAMGTHRGFLRGPHHSPQGVSDFKLKKTKHLRRGFAMCHILLVPMSLRCLSILCCACLS